MNMTYVIVYNFVFNFKKWKYKKAEKTYKGIKD